MHWQIPQGIQSRYNVKNLNFRFFWRRISQQEKIRCVCVDVSNGYLSDMGCERLPMFLKVSIITEAKKKKKQIDRANYLLHLIKQYSFTLIELHHSQLYPFRGHSTEKPRLVTAMWSALLEKCHSLYSRMASTKNWNHLTEQVKPKLCSCKNRVIHIKSESECFKKNVWKIKIIIHCYALICVIKSVLFSGYVLT